jgi:HSP20 family protein
VIAPVAGVDEKSLEISLTDDLLSIKGNRPRPKSLPQPQRSFAEECYWGSFSRNILLPAAVNSADMSARLESDIIVIEIPKARKATSKIISLTHRK